ncbi:MAG TPA: hypothetical protein VFO66_08605, partial [Gemmatimonadaceae bacterium]|nr:hypothetical protein [Gemmatimonadaceae bacterium]
AAAAGTEDERARDERKSLELHFLEASEWSCCEVRAPQRRDPPESGRILVKLFTSRNHRKGATAKVAPSLWLRSHKSALPFET